VDIGYNMVRYGLLEKITHTIEHYVRGTREVRAVGGVAP
jgi:hypothetical protein